MHTRPPWAPLTVVAAAVLPPSLQQRGGKCFVAYGIHTRDAQGRSWDPFAEAHDTVAWKCAAGQLDPGGPAISFVPLFIWLQNWENKCYVTQVHIKAVIRDQKISSTNVI